MLPKRKATLPVLPSRLTSTRLPITTLTSRKLTSSELSKLTKTIIRSWSVFVRLRVWESWLVWFGLFGWVMYVRVSVLVLFFVRVRCSVCSFAFVCVRVMVVIMGVGGLFTVSFVLQFCWCVCVLAFEG